jgi:sterol desaturase/sphingolipid hydroxylase (fatty acid hydroxylase superfamily)
LSIVLHETLFPARNDWRPAIGEVLQDGLFLAIVQIALPFVLKALALFLIVSVAADGDALISGYWPHHAPVLAQVCLMLLIAEFFRYWIHRSLHVFGPLWQLHAVHHAADKLYTVNVGRFHPFDKAIQFLGDTVPFLLLGVTPEVFGAYFVFYAINGFYQHSNADISLGPINWIIAGPELHRWHHSASIKEAQSNYGNNLIVWDVLFGTRYLPKGQEVGAVGIGNSRWPNGFLRQMTAPFTTPTDRPDK